MTVPWGKNSCFFTMYVQQAYFAKCQTTAKPQTTLKFSDQGYKTEFQVSLGLPSILGPSMEPDSHCFLTLITKLQSHLALSGPSLFCKIPLWSIYTVHVHVCALKASTSKWRAGVSISTNDRRNASATMPREVGYFFPRRRSNVVWIKSWTKIEFARAEMFVT